MRSWVVKKVLDAIWEGKAKWRSIAGGVMAIIAMALSWAADLPRPYLFLVVLTAAVLGFLLVGALLWVALLVRRLRTGGAPPPSPPFHEGWLEKRLVDGGFEPKGVKASASKCHRFLVMGGIVTQDQARAFIDDMATRNEIQEMYREELRNSARTLEAYGYCHWGPALHRSPPETKQIVRLYIRQGIGSHWDETTGQEKTREVQDRELALAPIIEITQPVLGARIVGRKHVVEGRAYRLHAGSGPS